MKLDGKPRVDAKDINIQDVLRLSHPCVPLLAIPLSRVATEGCGRAIAPHICQDDARDFLKIDEKIGVMRE